MNNLPKIKAETNNVFVSPRGGYSKEDLSVPLDNHVYNPIKNMSFHEFKKLTDELVDFESLEENY